MEGSSLLLLASANDALASVQQAVQAAPHQLYILLQGWDVSPSHTLINRIVQIMDLVAVEKPCFNVVPLLDWAGWSTELIAALPDLTTVFSYPESAVQTAKLLKQLQELRPEQLPSLRLRHLQCSEAQRIESGDLTRDAASGVTSLQPQEPLQYRHVAVGGTFDRLHAGHRILLAATALISTDSVYIGVTSDKLLANKQHRALLQSYDTRRTAAIAYLKAIRPSLNISGGALTDPKEPTAAATEAGMQALVVSQETVQGAESINKDREGRGFKPLTIVVVNTVGSASKELGGVKLSSTALRARDAANCKAEHVVPMLRTEG